MRVPHTVHMPDQITRRQHTVPKTLLRGFSDPKRYIAMKRRDGTDGVISLNNAAVRGDFYSTAAQTAHLTMRSSQPDEPRARPDPPRRTGLSRPRHHRPAAHLRPGRRPHRTQPRHPLPTAFAEGGPGRSTSSSPMPLIVLCTTSPTAADRAAIPECRKPIPFRSVTYYRTLREGAWSLRPTLSPAS